MSINYKQFIVHKLTSLILLIIFVMLLILSGYVCKKESMERETARICGELYDDFVTLESNFVDVEITVEKAQTWSEYWARVVDRIRLIKNDYERTYPKRKNYSEAVQAICSDMYIYLLLDYGQEELIDHRKALDCMYGTGKIMMQSFESVNGKDKISLEKLNNEFYDLLQSLENYYSKEFGIDVILPTFGAGDSLFNFKVFRNPD